MAGFVERLLRDGNAPLLEHTLRFTAARHRLIAENVVNVDTPGYAQKDLSPAKFHALMRERVDARNRGGTGPGDDAFADLRAEIESPTRGILFHDGNNRSMEQLMADQAKNALMHNLAVELLRKQYGAIEAALRERIA